MKRSEKNALLTVDYFGLGADGESYRIRSCLLFLIQHLIARDLVTLEADAPARAITHSMPFKNTDCYYNILRRI